MKKLVIVFAMLMFAACGSKPEAVLSDDIAAPDISEVLEDISATDEMAETGHLVIYIPFDDQHIFNPPGMIEASRIKFEEKFDGWTAAIETSGRLGVDTSYGVYNFGPNIAVANEYFNNLPDEMNGKDASEKVPDIVGMRAADRNRLLKDGLLADMVPLFNADRDFKIDRLLPGVVRAMGDGGSMYSVPSSFSFNCLYITTQSPLEFDGGVLPSPWNWDSAVEYFLPEYERLELPWLIGMPPQTVLEGLIKDYSTYFYDEAEDKYDFNSEVFNEILQTVKMLNDRELTQSLDDYIAGRGSSGPGSLMQIFDLNDSLTDFAIFKRQGYANQWFPLPSLESAEGISIAVFDEIAINSQSENKAAAWEFIKIFLSDEVQNRVNNRDQPVTANMNAESVNRAQLRYAGYELSDADLNAYNAGRQDYLSAINARALPYDISGRMEIIVRHAENYLRGDLELDEMIAALQTEMDGTVR